MPIRRPLPLCPAALAVLVPLSLAPAQDQPDPSAPPNTITLDLDNAPIATLLQALDQDVRTYDSHITTLAGPYFEGRAPGLAGNRRAADYIAFWFEHFGLQPAFDSTTTASEGSTVLTPRDSYFQPFDLGSEAVLESAAMSAGPIGDLREGRDFVPLGFSATSGVDAPITFVGYAIESGRDSYTSFDDDTDLTGRIAMVLRFEPMDADGRSLWLPGGWSPNAGLEAKFRAVARRGAVGIILVNPPGADDERIGRLETFQSIRPFGGPLDIPVVQVTPARADEIVRRFDRDGRSLLDLRRLADAGPAVVDLGKQRVAIDVRVGSRLIETQNVGAILPGRGELANEFIVIGAHYDHVGLGYGGAGSRAGAAGIGVLHPGADDNGSGTSGLLLAAQMLAERYEQLPEGAPARSILFLAFSAEELGLIGSRYYTDNPIVPIEQHAFMLNMDMIGRLRENAMELGGVATAPGLWEWLEPMIQPSGIDVRPTPSGYGPSDHANFYRAGMPVLFFFTMLHDEYHMPTDFSWTINRVGAVRVVRLCVTIAEALATRPERFRHTSTPSRIVQRPQARAYLGVMADDAPATGVLLGSVVENGPAAQAGLREGDIILRWNDTDIQDLAQWRALLGEQRAGDVVTILIEREGQEVELACTLGER